LSYLRLRGSKCFKNCIVPPPFSLFPPSLSYASCFLEIAEILRQSLAIAVFFFSTSICPHWPRWFTCPQRSIAPRSNWVFFRAVSLCQFTRSLQRCSLALSILDRSVYDHLRIPSSFSLDRCVFGSRFPLVRPSVSPLQLGGFRPSLFSPSIYTKLDFSLLTPGSFRRLFFAPT